MKFVDKQLALKLKEKGFDKPCFGWYDSEGDDDELLLNTRTIIDCNYKDLLESTNDIDVFIDAPTIDQVLEWLREEKHIYISIDVCKGFDDFVFAHEITSVEGKWREDNHYYDSYDDAILAGINFIVEHLI